RYHGVRLTERGRRVALEVIRHHRLVELFLVESLGMTWDEVHAEAEVLEHALSEELEELIATKLGNPTVDPHGDPIPSRELKLAETSATALAELEPGETATFVRVSDADPEMLRFLGERDIVPGTRLVLAANLMAMLIQYLSAKLGIITDRDLPESFREHYPRALSWGMWVQAEIISMSTDIAEFLGAALGLNLLFNVPLLPAGFITGVIA